MSHFRISAVPSRAFVAALILLATGRLAPRLSAQENRLTPRQGLIAAEVNGTIYTFGGYDADNEPLSTVECYYPATDLWKRGADMPTARGLLGAATLGSEIYLIGGTRTGPDKLGTVETYDPKSNSWDRVADLPTPRNALSAATVGERIYAIGGWGVDGDGRARDFDTVEVYDPRSDSWAPGAPMPAGRSHMAIAVEDGKIYTIGGWMRRAGLQTALNEVAIYDPQTDSWSSAADMPTARWLATAAVIDGRIYVLGGWAIGPDGQRVPTAVVEVLDPATGIWARDVELPTPRAGHASAVVGAQILLVGGSSTTTVDRYTPSDFTSLARIVAADSGAAGVASTVEFRDGGAYGRILGIEEPFGNLHTTLVRDDLQRLGLSPGSTLVVHIGPHAFPTIFGKDFSDVGRGEWVAFVMPDGTVTVARNFASAAEDCGCVAGATIFLTGGE